MSFRVIGRLREDGDFEPIAAFSLDLKDNFDMPVDDWVLQISEFIDKDNPQEKLAVTDLANAEDVISEDYFQASFLNNGKTN